MGLGQVVLTAIAGCLGCKCPRLGNMGASGSLCMGHWSLLPRDIMATHTQHCVGICSRVAAVTIVTSKQAACRCRCFRQVWVAGAGPLLHGQHLALRVLPQRCMLACGAPGGQPVKARMIFPRHGHARSIFRSNFLVRREALCCMQSSKRSLPVAGLAVHNDSG